MSQKVRACEITADETGQRVDNFLFRYYKGVPKSRIYRAIRHGEVRVNKKRIKVSHKLETNDIVRLPPLRIAERQPQKVSFQHQQQIENAILFEDDKLLVINKPAGLAVHGGTEISTSLIEALRLIRPQSKTLELIHRIDKATSGCLLIAKKRSVLRQCHELMRDGEINKAYLAVVAGQWPRYLKQIDLALEKNTKEYGEHRVKVSEDGKASETHFRVIERFENITLVEAKLLTGRTHQIRVHCQAAGHPIIGDEKYGDRSINRHFRKFGMKRMYLHAEKISFILPDCRTKYEFVAPIEKEWTSSLRSSQ